MTARARRFAAEHETPLAIWLALRVGLSLLALMAGLYLPSHTPQGTAPYHLPPAPALWDRLVGVWAHWDGLWYLQIASSGYRPGDGTTAFFPLYPWAVGAFGALLGGRYLLAGVVLSSLIFAGVLLLLYRLVSEQYPEGTASRAVLYLAIFPTAFFFWAVYSEGLFLLLALGMFYAASHRRWLPAGLCLAAALWTRPFGVVLLPCLLLEAVSRQLSAISYQPSAFSGRWSVVSGQPRFFAALRMTVGRLRMTVGPHSALRSPHSALRTTFCVLLLPLAAAGGLLAWSGLALGDPVAFLTTQAEWNRAFSLPWNTVVNAFKAAADTRFAYQEENQSWFYLATLLLFGGLAVAGWVSRGGGESYRPLLRPSHALYLTLGLLFPLLSATPRNPLLSLPRFALVLFPAFILMARAGRRPWLHYVILAVSLLLLGLYTIRFANWFWVA
ncbi:MAG: mannosyltransferase family protein [Chloroflexia bacterium]